MTWWLPRYLDGLGDQGIPTDMSGAGGNVGSHTTLTMRQYQGHIGKNLGENAAFAAKSGGVHEACF